jgi:hypothetical protein
MSKIYVWLDKWVWGKIIPMEYWGWYGTKRLMQMRWATLTQATKLAAMTKEKKV